MSGPEDYRIVTLWYDRIFGTFAFEPITAGPAKLEGHGPPDEDVILTVGERTFRTVTDRNGRYAFRAPSIPAGRATLVLGGDRTEVDIAKPGT